MLRVEHASVNEMRVRIVSSLNVAAYSSLQMSRTSRPQIAKSRLRCAVSSYSSVSLSMFNPSVEVDEHGAMVVAAKSPRRIAASWSSAFRNTLFLSFKAANMAMSLVLGALRAQSQCLSTARPLMDRRTHLRIHLCEAIV